MIVIDASVAAKWFLPEKGREAARKLLTQKVVFIAPWLIKVEVAAAITKTCRIENLSANTSENLCLKWFNRLERGTVNLEDTEADHTAAAQLSSRLSHSYQDCLYLALAQRYSIPIVSADKKQIKKAQESNIETLSFAEN